MVSKHRIVFIPLRLSELVFGATVIGLILTSGTPVDPADPKFLYATVISALSILLSLIWGIPMKSMLVMFLVDFFMLINWIVVFVLMAEYIAPMKCGSIWAWGEITKGGPCSKWTAVVAFSFLSAAVWFLSFFAGFLVVYGKSPRPPLKHCWKPVRKYIVPQQADEEYQQQ